MKKLIIMSVIVIGLIFTGCRSQNCTSYTIHGDATITTTISGSTNNQDKSVPISAQTSLTGY